MERSVSPEALGAVSARLTQVLARHTGRGPREAKSYLNDDLLVTVLQGGLTPLELSLVRGEHGDVVRDVRLALDAGLRDELTEAVEEIVGRTVVDLHGQVLLRAELLVKVFVLGARRPPADAAER